MVTDIIPTESGYDGGDCCQCTCVSNRDILCGEAFGFACIDPLAPCVDDDDVTALPEDDFTYTGSSTTLGCVPDYFSDGLCDMPNNNEDCGESRLLTKCEGWYALYI